MDFATRRVPLPVLGIAVGISAVASAAITWALFNSTTKLKPTTNSPQPPLPRTTPPSDPAATNYSEELIREQLARNYAFLGESAMADIRSKFIVVVGTGGVGSWTATMLVRSGVSQLRIIDFDQVSLSSLNRHACATLADVGTPKVTCLKRYLQKVAPWATIDARNELFAAPDATRLLDGNPDMVIDCIDNIDTKVDLLLYCTQQGIPVVSSMGAACKADPTRLNVGDISVTSEDPLSRAVRRRLRLKGVVTGIPVVYSSEKPGDGKAQLLPLPEEEFQKGSVDQLGVLKDFRVRILPVLGTMPAIFGLTIVTHVLTSLAGYPIEYIFGKNRVKNYDQMLQTLAGQQARLGYEVHKLPISVNDVGYILEEVFRGKSPISGFSTQLTLSRWVKDREISFQNVVVMTKAEQKRHEKEYLKVDGAELEDLYTPEVLKLVEKRFKEEAAYAVWRE